MKNGLKKKMTLLLSVVSIMFILTGCNNSSTLREIYDNPNDIHTNSQTVVENSVDEPGEMFEFKNDKSRACDIMDAIYEQSNSNTAYSDLSLNMALALAMSGSENNTLAQFESYFGTDFETKQVYYKDLISKYAENEIIDINLANSVWSDSTISLNSEYINRIKKYYNADASVLDFTNSASADKINNWCAEHTNNKIKEIISPTLLSQNKNVLINALYFNGNWAYQFTDDQIYDDEKFVNLDESETDVTMMHSTENTYYENNMAIAFAKQYDDPNFVFIGILPKNTGDFKMADLDIESLLMSETTEYEVDIKIPKFKMEYTTLLNKPVMRCGLTDMFNVDAADFSIMSDNDLYVTQIVQKVYIDIDEKGTEAAAVTGMFMNLTCTSDKIEPERKKVYLDRPFAFIIYDKEHEECLFMGKITDMTNL